MPCYQETRPLHVSDALKLPMLLVALVTATSCRPVERSGIDAGAPGAAPAAPEVITTDSGIEMVLIPAGRFNMGSGRGEPDEAPVHEVQVDAFLMDRYEMTQEHGAELARGSPYLSTSPSHFKGPDLPVEMIGWDIAALYCNQRSLNEGLEPCYSEIGECDFEANGYRLPTEAEWEYACRAGSDTEYHFGSDPRSFKQYAWYADNSGKKTHPVGEKKPNAWGLFDMHGNVAEWCNDVYSENYYSESSADNPRGPQEGEQFVLRGGAWNCSAAACRSARRVGEDAGFADACFAQDAVGFRCVRKAPDKRARRENAVGREPSGGREGDSPIFAPQSLRENRDSPRPLVSLFGPLAPTEKPMNDENQNSGPVGQTTGKGDPKAATGFLYDDIYLRHKTGAGHPERPARLEAIIGRLKEKELLSQLTKIDPRPTINEWLTSVHKPEYVDRVKGSCEKGLGYVDTMDSPAGEDSYEVAVTAAGGLLAAVDAVMDGKVRNAFCAVRPPGHHALPNRAMGFCLFNNVAIAARYIQKKHKLSKVLIVDWDVHHGNGTQDMFYDDPTVLYFSVHRFPFYPGTGSADQKGSGKGQGYTVNVPLRAGCGDREFVDAIEEELRPAATDFDPDFVLISAGFDAHETDPLGGMEVTAEGFARMTRVVKEIADKCAGGRLVSVLEGGYSLEGLAASVEAHIRALME